MVQLRLRDAIVGALGALCLVPSAHAATVEVTASGADFRVFVPDVANVRGIITSFNGSGGDFRSESDKPTNQAVATSWGFAYVATRGFGGGDGNTMVAQLNAALAQVGSMTGHAELKNAPLFLTGYSLGGGAVCSIAATIPQRVIGFVSFRGGNAPGTLSSEARRVPGLFIIASGDSTSARAWDIYKQWREDQMGLDAFAVEWVAQHVPAPMDDGMSWTLAWVFGSELIRLRYPTDRFPTATASPALIAISEQAGWIGDHPIWTSLPSRTSAFPAIAPFDEYVGERRLSSWLPSEAVAHQFRAFVARDKLSAELPRNVPLRFTSPATKSGTELTAMDNGLIAVKLAPRSLTAITELEIFAGAKSLAKLTNAPWEAMLTGVPPGIHGITAVATTDTGKHPSYEAFLVKGAAAFGTDHGTIAPVPTQPDAGVALPMPTGGTDGQGTAGTGGASEQGGATQKGGATAEEQGGSGGAGDNSAAEKKGSGCAFVDRPLSRPSCALVFVAAVLMLSRRHRRRS